MCLRNINFQNLSQSGLSKLVALHAFPVTDLGLSCLRLVTLMALVKYIVVLPLHLNVKTRITVKTLGFTRLIPEL